MPSAVTMSQKEVDLAGASSSKDANLSEHDSDSESSGSDSYLIPRKDQHKDGHFRSFAWDDHHYCIACKVKGKKSSSLHKEQPLLSMRGLVRFPVDRI